MSKELENQWNKTEILIDIDMLRQDETFILKGVYNPLLKLGYESAWNHQQEKIDALEKKLAEAASLIDWLWEHEPNQSLMLDKIQEYLKEKEAQSEK